MPLVAFVLLAGALGVGLTLDPRIIPSAMKGKSVPDFALPPVAGRTLGLASTDLRDGEATVVNVFASWCVPCRVEHPLLVQLARQGIAVHGLNYKDAPERASNWLDTLGDPFRRTGADLDGRVSIDWGVYGVPETFVVSGEGTIVEKHVGPLSPEDIAGKIVPALERARR
ncbi:MAG: DsbE family thiol:disulfide interchange protein [Alphaproteobacteria bacterium]|nr:DsbE family thiol:disulfide interchange protein [Alphaproteobacteria bacterium]